MGVGGLHFKVPDFTYLVYYRPQRSCGQGYVFTRVCDSVHRGGLQAGPPGRENPPSGRENPPRPGRHPPGQADTPPGQGRHPTPGPSPPPARRLQHTVNDRPVRILLECILVSNGTAKTMLVILAFWYCGGFVKNTYVISRSKQSWVKVNVRLDVKPDVFQTLLWESS